jgi:hypothetical protein
MTQNPQPISMTATASPASPAPAPRDARDTRDTREWTPQYKSVARRSLVVLGARIQPEWLSRTVNVLQVRFVGELAQVLGDLGEMAQAKKSKALPTVRLKASLALMLDGLIQIDRYLGLRQDNPRPALELYRPEGADPADDADHTDLIDRIRSCLKVWNNDVVQTWARANGFGDAVERLGRAITAAAISVTPVPQPLVQRANGSRLGRPAYHLIARRLAEELVGASLFEGMSPVDLVVDPSDTSASVELLTQPVRMEGSRNMFSMAARLSVLTMPSSRNVFVKITPVKRIWSAELPGRKPNAPPNVGCTVMVPGKPFLMVRATQEKERGAAAVPADQAPKSPWRFGEEYEEFLRRSKGMLPATLQEAVANLAPDPQKEGWWVGFPRLTTLFDRIGGRTVFERDEFDLHETVVQMLPWALDPKLEFRRVKAVAQKAAADATHTALKPSDIGQSDDGIEPGRAGQALLEDDRADDDRHSAEAGAEGNGDTETARDVRLANGQASNVEALRALHGDRSIHLFVFGGEEREQDIIKACASVLFGQAVQVHTEALPLHTHGLKADLEKADAKSLERFQARVSRWEAAFKQLPDDGGARYVLICAERMVGRRIEDTVNYYAAIHAACRTAKANVHYVLPIQQKRGKDDVGHFVHRVQSAMLDVFLAHAGVVLGVDELVKQTIGAPPAAAAKGAQGVPANPSPEAPPHFVVGVQAVRSRARRRSAEDDVSFILYSRLSLKTGLVQVKIACQIANKDQTTEWVDLASGLRWLGAQRAIASNEVWIREAFQAQTRSMLAKLKAEDPRAIVLIDWMRLAKIWPQLRDDQLCEVAPGSIFLGSTDLSSACPNMTFVRLRSSRDTSMTIRRLTTKLYEGWVTGLQGLEPTGEVYTERYMGPAHEIIEVVASDAKERSKPGRWSNRHYLQVMRYRRTVQLQRGYSCYRSSVRMKEIDGADKADAPSSKRFKIVKFEPHHEDAALPATTEVTVVAGPAEIDADQVVRLVMGLRLRYAHYPDWTALPAPLFFILKVDDYVIRYADLARSEEEEAPAAGAADDGVESVADAEEVPASVGAADLIEAAEAAETGPLPLNRDPYFDDVSRAIVQKLPQLQLFDAGGGADPGSTTSMRVAESIVSDPPYADATPCLEADDFEIIGESVPVIRVRDVREPGDLSDPSVSAGAAAAAESGEDEEEEEEPEETDAERALRRPKDELLAKAWDLIQEVPALYLGQNVNHRRIFEDMLRLQLRVTVDLPWFINAETVVPADAWPDHKAISRFWRMQGDRGWRLPNKPAPKTAEFKGWLMQRLRIPQSSWSVSSSQLFKGGIRIFESVYKQYDQMLTERATKGLEPPRVPGYAVFNSEELARWLRTRDDDEGLGWLVAMSAHWPDTPELEKLFEALDGMALGARTRCALEYVIDCCEVVKDLADMPLAKRRTLQAPNRKRDPRWEEEDGQRRRDELLAKADETTRSIAQHAKTAIAAAASAMASGAEEPAPFPAHPLQDTKPAVTQVSDGLTDGKALPVTEQNPTETAMLRDAAAMDTIALAQPMRISFKLLGEKTGAATAALQGVLAGIDGLKPGSEDFDQALQAVRDHLETLIQVHGHAMAERARREEAAAAAAATAAEAAARAEALRLNAEQERANRLKAVSEFFIGLRAACASVPADLVHEALVVPGDADAWGLEAVQMQADDYRAWIDKLRARAKAIQDEAQSMQATQASLDALDEGRDERLAAVSGLARRQLLLTLQNGLIQNAAGANHRMATALAQIAGMAPSGTQGGPEDGERETVAELPSAAVQVPQVDPGAPIEHVVDKMTALLADIEQGVDPVGPIPDSTPTVPTTAGPPSAVATDRDVSFSEALSAAVSAEASTASVEVIPDPNGVAEEDEDEPEDAAAAPIEVDAEFDVSTLDKLIEPLQVASSDRLWKLTRVGVKALCAIRQHPTVVLHANAWNSMLESLSALTTPGRDQHLDPALLGWLEAEIDGSVGDGLLGFAIDVGVLGAGLMPILFEGHEARARWAVLGRVANRFHDHRPLQELCEHLQNLDSSSFTITRENLSAARVGPRKALEAEVQRQRDRAQHWADDPVLFRNWPNPEYWDMHAAMFDDRHGMHFAKAMQHVVRGADDHLRKMLPELRKYVEKTPGTLSDLRKRTGRKRPLEGPHAEKLAQNLAASVKFIEDYLVLTGRLSQVATVDTPRPQRDFLDQLYAKTQAAKEYLDQIQADLTVEPAGGLPTTPVSGESRFLRLHASLARQVMEATLGLMSEEVPNPPVAEDEQVLLMDAAIDSSLEPVWSVQLGPEGTPATLRDPLAVLMEVAGVQQQLVAARQAKPQQKIEDLLDRAADTHRQRGEILAARAIEQRMRNVSAQVLSQMQSHNETAHRKLRSALSEELSDARQRVTNALSVGPMTQAEASRMLKVIETLDRANREGRIGAIVTTPAPFEDYPQARALLHHHIIDPLQQRIHESLRALKDDISAFREKLEKMGLEESDRARKIEQLDRIVAGLKEVTPTNIRVARHSFSLLEQDQLPLFRFNTQNPAQAYEAFQRDLSHFTSHRSPLESLRDALRSKADDQDDKHWPKGQKPSWAAALSEEQSAEAADFLDAWMELTEARILNEIHDPLARFFKAAGTVEAPTAMSEPGNNSRTAFHLPAKTFVGSARLQNFWVPPVLGSAARDLRGVVLKHRPAPELVAQVIEELPMTTPNFVLGRTRLNLPRRSAISRDHPVILVDDDLVAYMAVHPEHRLAKMMEVGLLTFRDNPYDDYGGPVPTEMFFGRRSELMRLAGNKSAMVLYGGRRLGKSSLLDRIQMESRQSLVKVGGETRGEVAIYIPLESRIDSAVFGDDHKLFAWMGIYRAMVANSFIKPAKTEPKTADAVFQHIRGEIMAGNALTKACYLLIDEADEVMGRDIESSGAFASSLRALCDDVRDVCTIRYVIAGLHNLTRLHTEGNTALAKADAIALQPFSSGQDILMGVDLITKPLAALGFVFPKGSEELPMRILAMCNFYPAFVQLYCKNLIQDLYNKRGQKAPTTPIEASDLDKVERNKDFIGVMQEKFRYNLDLDKRYKGIALVLADTYYHGSGAGVEQGLTATDLRSICDEYFSNYFSKTGEGAFPALLEEMEKLTVIDRKGGRYQLRTPHIATMMGSKEDVEHKIEELRRETAPANRIPGETRPLLTRGNVNDWVVFPMSSGWVRQLLHEEERNLVILVGNHLSGLVEIENIKHPFFLGRDAQYEIKFFSNIDNARPYLNAMRRASETERPNRIVAVPSRAWQCTKNQIEEFAAFSRNLARPLIGLPAEQRQRATNVRLLLVANPEQAWELAKMVNVEAPEANEGGPLASNGSFRLAQLNWRVEAVPAWNDDAVYYRLKQLENETLPDHPEVCAEVLEATMGFGGELAKMLRASTRREGVADARNEIGRRVASSRETFYAAIGWSPAIDPQQTRAAEALLSLLDGERRSEEIIVACAKDCSVSSAMVTYMRWMGLLQDGEGGTWRVPALYKALIAPPADGASNKTA